MMNGSIQFIVCVLAILCQNINSAVAQTRSYDGVISVVPVQLEQRGKSVYINIDFVLEDVKVKSAHGVDFIPQLVAPAHTYNLPKVSIKGHNEYLAYERWLLLMSAKEKDSYEKPYVVEKGSKKRNDTIRYRYILPYESWMDDARVDVQRDECGCGEIQWQITNVCPKDVRWRYVIIWHPDTISREISIISSLVVKTGMDW